MISPSPSPDFEKMNDLLPVITQCVKTGKVLMLAYMNAEAYAQTVKTGLAHYYSRSKKALWKKGESSGHIQKVHSLRLDCDADSLLLLVEQVGAACHTGYASCFYREYKDNQWAICEPILFDPKEVY